MSTNAAACRKFLTKLCQIKLYRCGCVAKFFRAWNHKLEPRLHYNVLGTARLALGTVPLFFSARHCTFTLIFLPCRFKNWHRTEHGCRLYCAHWFFPRHSTAECLHLRKSWYGTLNRSAKTDVFGSAPSLLRLHCENLLCRAEKKRHPYQNIIKGFSTHFHW